MRKQNSKSNPLFLSVLLFFKHCWCLDPSYESCVPKDCGDGRKISYPFYIKGLQDPSCGYPGFKLSCNNNGSSILDISGNDLVVKDIGYENRSVRLAINLQRCGSKMRNMTLDPNRFWIDTTTSTQHLVWISNCSGSGSGGNLSADLDKYRVAVGSCESESESRRRSKEFVMVENDANLTRVKEGCGEVTITSTPVELDLADGEVVVDASNYKEVVERGFVMQWRAANCSICAGSGGRCGFDIKDFQFRCFCPDRPHKVRCQPASTSEKAMPKLIIIAVVIGCAVMFTVVATAILLIRRGYKHKYKYSTSKGDKSCGDLEEDVSVYFGVSVFSYAELQDATNHFDSSKELGDGGFGTVYYGKLRDGREVAVKRLYEHNYKRVQQFMNEVEILTRLRHQNLVSLYGCTSRRSRELLLVYEYISNGTVADHLHGHRAKLSPLNWQTRMKIAIETASALVYLHASEIIHRDVKTNNILLDNNFCVKVADFGLSRLLPNDVTHVSTAPQGTPGYVDPEYHQCYQLTDKSDVYSFGVVLIELISSMPAIDISRSRDEISLANMAINRIQRCALEELIDPLLGSDMDTERMTTSVAELAFRCLQFDSETRPTMNEALEVLKGIQTSIFDDDDDDDSTRVEMKVVNKSELPLPLPPPSPENEGVGLLKRQIMASPISVTAKWHSTSSGSTTPNTASVCN